ncbi:unnamed protein product [Medioppia subpectinata]|uniref:Nuclear receptor domain-containing protein n=1 Tax=Medioppia subpectinata TaxID=1979941 RepID=A0A7R9KEI7_9ACAR|nr:unnamed protein product [Medioppia subpectinata]CAG2101855.1 unnamed protein product [Medioppia subpectinata]
MSKNFDVITCESCKAFFRRYALKNKQLMRSDEENEKRRKTIRENKLKREKCDILADSSVTSIVLSNDLMTIFNENKEKDILDEILDNTIDINLDEINEEITNIDTSITHIEINKDLEAIKHFKGKYKNTAIVPMFREITDYNGLNELETNRLSELSSAAVDDANFVQANISVFGPNNLDEWDYNDSTAINLLTAIILYNPNRPNLTHKHNVKLEQQLYIYLLQRYLLLKYRSESESRVGLPEYRTRNFAVITCESCKAFFRRYGAKNKPLYCPSNNKCIINLLTRKICKKCRLEKCFAVGMRKEFIRNDVENEMRRKAMRENKLKREKCDNLVNTSIASVTSCTDFSNDLIIFDENTEKDILDELLDNSIDINLDEINDEMTNIETSITDITIDKDLLLIPDFKEKCKNTAIVPIFREITDYNGLNALENNRLSELSSAAVVFNYKISNNIIQVNNLEEMLRICGRRQDDSLKDMVTFTKCLSGYNRICAEDRVALMKYGFNQLLSIRILKYYNKTTGNFYIPFDERYTVQANFNVFPQNDSNYTLHTFKPILNTLVDEWNYSDSIAVNLLTAIAFYNPNRPNLIHRHSVKRYGLKNKPLNCPSNGNCIISLLTRKLCQKCRLEKCFAVGMRKEFIRSDEQNEKRKKAMRENRLIQGNCDNLLNTCISSVSSSDDSLNDLIIFDENNEKDILDEILDNTIDINFDEITEIVNSITNITLDKDLTSIAKGKQKCKNTAIVPMFREITDYNGLNELESNRISELMSAAVVFNYKMSNNIRQVNSLEEMLRTCGPSQDRSVMDIINFAKSLSTFNTICSEDKVVLMKYGYNELLSIRTIKFYDKYNENFYIPLVSKNNATLNC